MESRQTSYDSGSETSLWVLQTKWTENSECWYFVVGLRVISAMSAAEESLSDRAIEQLRRN